MGTASAHIYEVQGVRAVFCFACNSREDVEEGAPLLQVTEIPVCPARREGRPAFINWSPLSPDISGDMISRCKLWSLQANTGTGKTEAVLRICQDRLSMP